MPLAFNEIFMAKTAELDVKTYYLYDQNWQISTKTKIIYSPFNVLKEWRTRLEDNYWSDPKKVVFIWWIYETNDPEEIEFLDKWNDAVWSLWVKLSNGKRFYNDWTHKIMSEKLKEKSKVEVQIEEKIVQTIPRKMAEMLQHKQLVTLCEEWWIALWDGDTKEMILEKLENDKHISD